LFQEISSKQPLPTNVVLEKNFEVPRLLFHNNEQTSQAPFLLKLFSNVPAFTPEVTHY